MAIKNMPIGQILLDSKLITADQLNSVLEIQKKSPQNELVIY